MGLVGTLLRQQKGIGGIRGHWRAPRGYRGCFRGVGWHQRCRGVRVYWKAGRYSGTRRGIGGISGNWGLLGGVGATWGHQGCIGGYQ